VKLPALPWEKLDKLKKPHKLGIFFGTILVLAAGFFFLFYQPLQNDITGLTEEIEKLETQILQHRKIAREMNKFKEQLDDVRLQFEFARRLLPDTKEVDQLLRDISDKGGQSGLNVILFQPNLQDELKDFYAEISFDMQVEGPYLNVARFFYELGRLPRIVNIKDIKMTNPRLIENDIVLTTSCQGVTFRFLTPQEQEAVKEAKAAEGKKKAKKK